MAHVNGVPAQRTSIFSIQEESERTQKELLGFGLDSVLFQSRRLKELRETQFQPSN